MTAFRRRLQLRSVQCGILVLLTLLLRIIAASGPYYVDSSRHIRAIETGLLVIHPPGYFFFNLAGLVLSHLLHVSAGRALQILNIAFSVAGVAVFYLLVSRIGAVSSPFWLSVVYTCSPVVWFSADIHCTYAAMTLFAPLLILVVEQRRQFVLGCIVWGLMTGFRQSDGVFLIPWMVYHALRFSRKEQLAGISIAIASVVAWWIPTAQHYGGGFFSPLRSSQEQVHGLAQGILSGRLGLHAAVNVFHTITGAIVTWGVLTPMVLFGAFLCRRNLISRSMVLFLAPGLAFFLLYFFSDATYLAYMAAAGFILAALYLANRPLLSRRLIYASTICASVLFMSLARPADAKPSALRAVVDAYFVRYSVPSLKKQQDPRLATLLGACGDKAVRGVCPE